MARQNVVKPRVARSPMKTVSATPNARTATGGQGYTSTTKSELFRLGVNALLGGENTYHEDGKSRDSRFTSLVTQVTAEDPQWVAGFLTWLRSEGNVRTASIMGAAHAVKTGLERGIDIEIDGKGFNRYLTNAVLQRADEPGELAAYWTSQFGSNLPKPVRRGLADAAGRLYNEFTAQKYDTDSKAWRFADVIQMAHVAPKVPSNLFDRMSADRLEGMDFEGYAAGALANRSALYSYLINDRYGNPVTTAKLPMIDANAQLREEVRLGNPRALLDPARLKAAGMTWEDVLSLAGTKIPKRELWESLIDADQLGHMALIRNLRNIQEAGIDSKHTALVIDRISNPEIVSKGRQFPFRYWSAYKNSGADAWKYPLAQALDLSTQNIPELNGMTYIFTDTSGSMQAEMSNKSDIKRVEAAALFAHSLAARNPGKVRVFEFASNVKEVPAVKKGASVLSEVEATNRRIGHVGHGTETQESVRKVLAQNAKPDRIVIFTDMQSFGGHSYGGYNYGYGSRSQTLDQIIPADVWTYAFDLAGYQVADLPSGDGRRHQLAGLTDAAFRMIPLLERGRNADWPWLAS